MPLAVYRCFSCKKSQEILHRGARPVNHVCPGCDGIMDLDLPATLRPARTSCSWGDSKGYYDRGLGTYIENAQMRDRICKERNLIPESELSCGAQESSIHDAITEKQEHTRQMSKVKDLMNTGLSAGESLSQVIIAGETE